MRHVQSSLTSKRCEVYLFDSVSLPKLHGARGINVTIDMALYTYLYIILFTDWMFDQYFYNNIIIIMPEPRTATLKSIQNELTRN